MCEHDQEKRLELNHLQVFNVTFNSILIVICILLSYDWLIDCSLLNIQCQIFQDENNREKYGELNRDDDKLNLLAYMEHGTLQT
jgi:hypothetical protein